MTERTSFSEQLSGTQKSKVIPATIPGCWKAHTNYMYKQKIAEDVKIGLQIINHKSTNSEK